MARQIELFEKDEFKSSELYSNILKVASEGMTLDVMRKRMSVIDKLEEAKDKVILEDAEWQILNTALKTNKWPTVFPVIIQACDAVEDAIDYVIEDVDNASD